MAKINEAQYNELQTSGAIKMPGTTIAPGVYAIRPIVIDGERQLSTETPEYLNEGEVLVFVLCQVTNKETERTRKQRIRMTAEMAEIWDNVRDKVITVEAVEKSGTFGKVEKTWIALELVTSFQPKPESTEVAEVEEAVFS